MADKQTRAKDKKSQPEPLSSQTKKLITAAILCDNITVGCSINILSPSLDNLRSKYGTTIEDISVVFTILTIMYCFGAIICSVIARYINRQLIVIAAGIGFTTSVYMIPYCPDKTMFFVCGGLLGFASGMHDSSQIVWMIEIWQNKAGPFIQSQHLFFAIGTVVAPVIVAPFLNKYDHSIITTTDLSTTEASRAHIPFVIVGTFASLALLFHIFLFTFYRYHTPPMYADENFELVDDATMIPSAIDTESKGGNVSTNRQENVTIMGVSSRKMKLVAITVAFLGAYQGMELSTMQFLPTFARYSDLKMTDSASSYVLVGLNGMFAVGRLVGTIIIFKVQPEPIIFMNFIFIIIGNTILMIWANSSFVLFWLGSMILGMGYSTMFPTFCVFIEKYLVMTTPISASICVVGSLVAAMYPVIIGKLIEHYPVVLTYTNLTSTFVITVAMIYGYVLTRKSVVRER